MTKYDPEVLARLTPELRAIARVLTEEQTNGRPDEQNSKA